MDRSTSHNGCLKGIKGDNQKLRKAQTQRGGYWSLDIFFLLIKSRRFGRYTGISAIRHRKDRITMEKTENGPVLNS